MSLPVRARVLDGGLVSDHVAAESDETLLSDAEVQTIYAAFDKVNATEARTVEGRRAIVTPLYRAVIQARIELRPGPLGGR